MITLNRGIKWMGLSNREIDSNISVIVQLQFHSNILYGLTAKLNGNTAIPEIITMKSTIMLKTLSVI